MSKLVDIERGLKQTYLDLVMNELNSNKKTELRTTHIVCSGCGWGGTLRKVIINGEKKYLCPKCYKKFMEEKNNGK